MTSWVSLLVETLRASVKRLLRRQPPAPIILRCQPTKFADTQDLLDDIRATQQTRGIDVRESELDMLPADVQRHFELHSPSVRG